MTSIVQLARTRSGKPALRELAGLAGPTLLLARASDQRLAALVRDGDENAFAAIVARYGAPLERHCRRTLRPSAAEDALAQTFANAYVALSRGAQPAALRPWLYAIAHNTSVNGLRDHASESLELVGDVRDPQQPHDIVARRESLQSVVTAVGGLPSHQRHVIVRQEFDGHSHEQIAGELGLTTGAVRQLAHRARRTVRAAAAAIIPAPLWQRVPWLLDSGDAGQLLAGTAFGAVVGKTAVVILLATAAGGALEWSATGAPAPAATSAKTSAPLAAPAGRAGATAAAAASGVPARAATRHAAVITLGPRVRVRVSIQKPRRDAAPARLPQTSGSTAADRPATDPFSAPSGHQAGGGAGPVGDVEHDHGTTGGGKGSGGPRSDAGSSHPATEAAEPAEAAEAVEIEADLPATADAEDETAASGAHSGSDQPAPSSSSSPSAGSGSSA